MAVPWSADGRGDSGAGAETPPSGWRRLLPRLPRAGRPVQARELIGVALLAALLLQGWMLSGLLVAGFVNPLSTTFQRSELIRLAISGEWPEAGWQQAWVPLERISPRVQRAVLAAEDANFAQHGGVEWEAIQRAWSANERAQDRAARLNERAEERAARLAERAERQGRPAPAAATDPPRHAARVLGGSTISQQLIKNLWLSGERALPRKAQELMLTLALEALWSKPRILEVYLNSVEFGAGIFGIQAAARHYLGADAAQLSVEQAARLAALLPAPKRFQTAFPGGEVQRRARSIAQRQSEVDWTPPTTAAAGTP